MYSCDFQSICLTLPVGVLNEDEGSSDDLTVMKKAQKDMESNIPFAIEWLKVVESSPTRSNHETSRVHGGTFKQVKRGKIRLLCLKCLFC